MRTMAYREGSGIMNKPLRALLFVTRFLQWASAVIVMGIASYYIAKYTRNEHIIYYEVIACTTVAFFLIPLFLSFVKRVTWHFISLDLIYSYLWLTAVVFTAQDYNYNDCAAGPPSQETSCSRKYALEAFTFLTFFFTIISMILQHIVWTNERVVVGHDDARVEKVDPTRPDGTGATGQVHSGVHNGV